jgi:hypothetical protein
MLAIDDHSNARAPLGIFGKQHGPIVVAIARNG